MKKDKYQVTITWWVGWIVLFPVRLAALISYSLVLAMRPSEFYGFNQFSTEKDQSKWELCVYTKKNKL